MPLVIELVIPKPRKDVTPLTWTPPPVGQVALPVDGAFSKVDGTATAGMILRHHVWTVIFAVYICLFHCNDALEVEMHARMQGMALAMQHTELPVIL